MSGTYFTLNQKYNNLKTQEQNNSGGGVPTSSNLATVLLNGNSAGTTNINMNGQDITSVGDIVFADGTTQSTSGYTKSFFNTFTTSPQSILLTELRSNYNVTWTGTLGTPVLSLRLPTTPLSTSSFITIYNNSTDADYGVISLNTNVTGRFFGGRFGSGIQTISLRPLNWITVAYNPATNTWDAISKSFPNVFEQQFTTAFNATNVSLANTLLRITNVVGATRTLYLSDTTYKPFNKNAYFYLENASLLDFTAQLVSDALLTPSTTSTFTGLYGSQLNTLLIPPQSTMTILISLAGQFIVQERTSFTQVYNVAYSGTTITTYQNPQYFDTLINLTGTVATDFYLPDPRISVNSFSTNRSITMNNDGSGLIRVFATDGVFGGSHGNSGASIYLPDSVTYTFFCNGSTWEINERSAGITYQNLNVDLTAVDYRGNYNYLSATLAISAIATDNLLYPTPSDSQAHLTTSIIRNVGGVDFSVFIDSGVFGGKYGSGTNLLVLPANTWVELFSNGTDYLVTNRSVENQFYFVSLSSPGTTSIANNLQYVDATVYVDSLGAGRILSIANPNNANTLYQKYKFYNTGSISIPLSASSAFTGKYGSGTTTLVLPGNTWVELQSSGSSNWVVQDRSVENQYYNLGTLTTTTSITTNFQYVNATVYVSSNADGRILSIANPDNVNTLYQKYKFYNNGSNSISLSASSAFTGKYGSGTTTLVLPGNTWVELQSDASAGWVVQDRSVENQVYYPTAFSGATASIVSNFQYINSELHLTSTFDRSTTVTIPAVSASGAINQKYIIYNDNNTSASPNGYQIILSSASNIIGTFLGAGGTTFSISPGCKVELYNNGTSWVVSDTGNSQVLTPQSAIGGTFVLARPYKKYNIINRIDGGVNLQLTMPTPLRSDIGNDIVVRLGLRVAGGGINISSTWTNPVFPYNSSQNAQASQAFGYQTNLQTIRLTVLQYAYAGAGTITTTLGSSSVTINTLTSGLIGPYCFLTVATSPPTTLQIEPNNTVSGGSTGLGGIGVYQITGFSTAISSGGPVAFTVADAFYWTLC